MRPTPLLSLFVPVVESGYACVLESEFSLVDVQNFKLFVITLLRMCIRLLWTPCFFCTYILTNEGVLQCTILRDMHNIQV